MTDDPFPTPYPADLFSPRYLTKRQLSCRTGLSPATIQRLKDRGQIPCYQPGGKGGRLLFPIDAIEHAVPASQPADGAVHRKPQRALSGRRPVWMNSAQQEHHE